MPETLRLPTADAGLTDYRVAEEFKYPDRGRPPVSRIPYAAVHVVADPLADTTPVSRAAIDWETTLEFRRHVWSYGLGVAEAMDTAQRGMGLDWASAKELIRRSIAEAKAVGGRIVCGVQTDHLPPGSARTLREVEAAYEEQCEFVEAQGGQVVLMASRELARIAKSADDYRRVYDEILSGLSSPALIHWLGKVFDPQLEGYWGSNDLDVAMATLLCPARAGTKQWLRHMARSGRRFQMRAGAVASCVSGKQGAAPSRFEQARLAAGTGCRWRWARSFSRCSRSQMTLRPRSCATPFPARSVSPSPIC